MTALLLAAIVAGELLLARRLRRLRCEVGAARLELRAALLAVQSHQNGDAFPEILELNGWTP